MNTNKSRLFVIELLLVIFLFFALFASNIINRFIVMLGILLITIITNYSLKKMNKKSIFDKRVTLLMVIFAIIYISIFYLLGLYYGFESNKYLLSFGNLFRVVIPLGIIIVSSEILRNNLINQNGKIKIKGKLFDLSLIFVFIAMTILDLVIYTDMLDLTQLDDFLKAIGFVLFSSFSCNLLYNYMGTRFGSTPVIVYRLITILFLYTFPILPDVYIFMRTFLRMLYPFLIYMLLEYSYSNTYKYTSNRQKSKDIIGTTVLLVIVASIVMLISCQFKYGILVIGSESMTGTINKGDAILITRYDGQEIKEGQVILFDYDGVKTVHRVVGIKHVDGQLRITTKGDANKSNDDDYRTENDVLGIVNLKIKYLGVPTLWVRDLFSNK